MNLATETFNKDASALSARTSVTPITVPDYHNVEDINVKGAVTMSAILGDDAASTQITSISGTGSQSITEL